MSMTDPIADLLTRIRNGLMAKHETVELPASKIKLEIVKILEREGYIGGFESIDEGPQGRIRVVLKYDKDGNKPITKMERVSKPGRRVYCGKDEIPSVRNGLGITILSTPEGVLTGTACRKQGLGGEVLCNIW